MVSVVGGRSKERLRESIEYERWYQNNTVWTVDSESIIVTFFILIFRDLRALFTSIKEGK